MRIGDIKSKKIIEALIPNNLEIIQKMSGIGQLLTDNIKQAVT